MYACHSKKRQTSPPHNSSFCSRTNTQLFLLLQNKYTTTSRPLRPSPIVPTPTH
ncbi:hypothetical protein VD0004_g5901 [Verticillium dahliae]|nr:hypothetical protein VD0004_g5901 [Verticillium dahliae]PNH73588.1 hypothetical protein VD0001_g3943 [Verticillium dahliae]